MAGEMTAIGTAIAPGVGTVIGAGLDLIGSIFNANTQASVNRDTNTANKDISDADRRFQYDKLLQEGKFQLEQLKLQGKITDQDYEVKKAQLAELISSNQKQYEINLQQLAQQGTISANELNQRKTEFDATKTLSWEKLVQDNKLAREQLSQGKDIATAQLATQKEITGAQITSAEKQKQMELAEAAAGRKQTGELETAKQTETERLNKARQEAYNQAIQKAGGVAQPGFDQDVSEMGKMKENLLSNQAETLQQGAGQLQAELAKQGVRGGQAATQLRRGIGEMTSTGQQDIDKLMYEEAQRRAAEKRAYQMQMALASQQALTSGAKF